MSDHKYFSLSYFNRLDLDVQGEEVFGKGKYFDTISDVVLYQYSDYLVECWYNVESNEIEVTPLRKIGNDVTHEKPLK